MQQSLDGSQAWVPPGQCSFHRPHLSHGLGDLRRVTSLWASASTFPNPQSRAAFRMWVWEQRTSLPRGHDAILLLEAEQQQALQGAAGGLRAEAGAVRAPYRVPSRVLQQEGASLAPGGSSSHRPHSSGLGSGQSRRKQSLGGPAPGSLGLVRGSLAGTCRRRVWGREVQRGAEGEPGRLGASSGCRLAGDKGVHCLGTARTLARN